MNTLLRSSLRASPLLRHPNQISRLIIRTAASSVSGRPGSQTVGHAATNVKEEIGNSVTDLAKRIAGGSNVTGDSEKPQKTFLGITGAIAHEVPKEYMIFGLAGGLPYLGASATTIYLAHQAGLAASGVLTTIDPGVAHTVLDQAFNIQVTYGAVMLSFLGALHWGMEFAGYGGHKGYPRLILGMAPVLYAWPTLMLSPTTALIAQWAGFTGLWWADSRATSAGWTPKWYSQYRFYLSILVGTCIIGTLASTSYYGPVAGHGIVTHDLAFLREQRKKKHPETEGVVGGDIETIEGGESGDSYVVIKKKEAKEEEGEGEEGGEAKGEEGGEAKDEEDGEAKGKDKDDGKKEGGDDGKADIGKAKEGKGDGGDSPKKEGEGRPEQKQGTTESKRAAKGGKKVEK